VDGVGQYALAYALTTAAGIRGLLTLALVSIAIHFHWLLAPEGFSWLGSNQTTIILCAVAVLDFVGDKIPIVDNMLHVVQMIAKPAVAAILVGGTVHGHSTPELLGLMALGALNAVGVHTASATIRGASTATTGGVGNPVISLVEDVIAAATTSLAIFYPWIAALIALVITVLIALAARGIWRGLHVEY
jgi:hypothetical protein